MSRLFDPAAVVKLAGDLRHWISAEVLVPAVLVQAALIPATFFAAWLLAPKANALIARLSPRAAAPFWAGMLANGARAVTLPLLWFLFAVVAAVGLVQSGLPDPLIRTLVRLLLAWIVIRVATAFIRDPALSRGVAVLVWLIAALNILGLLTPMLSLLDGIALKFGHFRLSLLTVLRGALVLAVLLWASTALSRLIERRIGQVGNLTPSVQVLFAKVTQISLLVLAFVIALRVMGIDLTGLALFSGAVGLGLGFGMQKIVSNLVSGLILLLDRSVKPGDVIAIGTTYGWVNEMGARYASIITRDGIEHLIPNEELITQRVENWSHSTRLVRLKTPIRVAFTTDVPNAIALCIEAAEATPRVLDTPKPGCLLKEFGENGFELELRFWINDAQNGIHNVQSEVLLGIWRRFHDRGIEIPVPKRDVRFAPAPVGLAEREEAKPDAEPDVTLENRPAAAPRLSEAET